MERMRLKTTYLLENKDKLAKMKKNMHLISITGLILPIIGYMAIVTLIRRPSRWAWDWEPVAAITILAAGSFAHLLYILVGNKGINIEFRKDPIRGFEKWLRLPLFGAASLGWGLIMYFLYWEWTTSLVFFAISFLLFAIIFRYNKGYYEWVDRILRILEKKEKRLKARKVRRKRAKKDKKPA